MGLLHGTARGGHAPPGEYRAVVDSTLEDGSLTYGEVRLDGKTPRTVLLTTTVCHPALANDNLSGIVVTAAVARALAAQSLRYSYRLLWSPGTMGRSAGSTTTAADRSANRARARDLVRRRPRRCHIQAKSPRNDADRPRGRGRARDHGDATLLDWSPYGGDERQFCAPGFDLPFGAFSRSPADAFPEYHSSDDDLSVVTPEALADSYRTLLSIIDVFERDRDYVNASPYGEPQLGRRGLYRSVGGGSSQEAALLWLLSLCDGAPASSTSRSGPASRSTRSRTPPNASPRKTPRGSGNEPAGSPATPGHGSLIVRPGRRARRCRTRDRPIELPPPRRARTEH